MKLSSLFTRHDTKLPPLGKELDAIEAGKKPLSFFASHRDVVEDGSDLAPVMRGAFDRGLGISLLPQPQHKALVDIYVFRVGESWRADEFHEFFYTSSRVPWTFANEEKQSRLLGYSTADWMKRERATYIRYGLRTVYAISSTGLAGVEHVFTGEGAVYPSARSKLPRGAKLLRFGVDPRAKRKHVLDGILAGPEVLGPRGWTALR
jgi:hypothetical protein